MAAPMRDPYTEPTTLARVNSQTVTAPKNFALRVLVEGHGDVIGPLCRASGIDPEVLISELYLMSQKQPDLLKATPATLLPAIADGLKVGARFGTEAYILTFKNNRAGTIEATPSLDYKFWVKLILAAGVARRVDVQLVYKHDTFREVHGSEPRLIHELPPFGTDRGPIVGAYAIAHFGVNTPPRWKAMTDAEVEVIRKKSHKWNPRDVPECPDWYRFKCCLRRLSKLLPDNPKLAQARAIMERDSIVDGDDAIIDQPLELAPDVPADVNPAPMPADDNISPELARALAYSVKGRTLADLANDELTKLEQWAHDKGNTRVADMCGLVRHHRTVQAATRELEAEEVTP